MVFGFENRKINGVISVIFPEYCDPTPTIYFPEGVYRVSDTSGYSFENLQNGYFVARPRGMEPATHIRIMRQNKDKTVIRLDDKRKGFEFGQQRPVLSVFKGIVSNAVMSNYVENITIDTGSDNPDAVGLEFYANNSGAVRDANIAKCIYFSDY